MERFLITFPAKRTCDYRGAFGLRYRVTSLKNNSNPPLHHHRAIGIALP